MKRIVPSVIHGLLIFLIGIMPLWLGGYGTVDFWLAVRATFYILVGVVLASALNEFLVHASDIDWENQHGKWKIVLPLLATFVGANLFGPDDPGKRAAMSVASGLMVLTALRWQTNTDVLLRLGTLAALAFGAWGIAGNAFWVAIPPLLLLALAFAYEPPEARSYLSLREHGKMIAAILAMGASVLAVLVMVGVGLHLLGLELNPPAPPAEGVGPREPYGRENKISWLHFVALAAILYFGIPYLIRMANEKRDGEGIDLDAISSQPRRIADQFKRILGQQTPRERVIYSYHEMLKRIIKLGYVHNPAHTPERIGREIHGLRGIDQTLLAAINHAFYRACYTDRPISDTLAREAEVKSEQVVEAYRLGLSGSPMPTRSSF